MYCIPIRKHLKKVQKQDAKIAITFPAIKNHTVDLEYISKETGLNTVIEPIIESRHKQFVGRQIVVFV